MAAAFLAARLRVGLGGASPSPGLSAGAFLVARFAAVFLVLFAAGGVGSTGGSGSTCGASSASGAISASEVASDSWIPAARISVSDPTSASRASACGATSASVASASGATLGIGRHLGIRPRLRRLGFRR